MDSIAGCVDAVRDAVRSISTCTPTVSATVKELLLNDNHTEPSKPTPRARPTKATRAPSRTNSALATARGKDNGGSLSPKEKAVLATQIITGPSRLLVRRRKLPLLRPQTPANRRRIAQSNLRLKVLYKGQIRIP